MVAHRVLVLYDRIEDDVYEEARAARRDTRELVPVHVPLGEALAARGHEVRKLAVGDDLAALVRALLRDRSDVVFNVCDGVLGHTRSAGCVAGILELLGKPFTGSGSVSMAVAGDKVVAKRVLAALGISTPRYAVVRRGELPPAPLGLAWPAIVKPVDEDASVGISERSVVRDDRALAEQVRLLHEELRVDVLVEEFVVGREVYAGVLGNDPPGALPLVEWPLRTGHGIGSWDAKWRPRHRDYQRCADVFATDIEPTVVARIQREAVLAFRALGLADYGRADIRLDATGTPWFLEVNPNPFFEEGAEIAQACRAIGLDYPALADRVVELALARHRRPAEAARVAARAA